jgi:hypothetical protein
VRAAGFPVAWESEVKAEFGSMERASVGWTGGGVFAYSVARLLAATACHWLADKAASGPDVFPCQVARSRERTLRQATSQWHDWER